MSQIIEMGDFTGQQPLVANVPAIRRSCFPKIVQDWKQLPPCFSVTLHAVMMVAAAVFGAGAYFIFADTTVTKDNIARWGGGSCAAVVICYAAYNVLLDGYSCRVIRHQAPRADLNEQLNHFQQLNEGYRDQIGNMTTLQQRYTQTVKEFDELAKRQITIKGGLKEEFDRQSKEFEESAAKQEAIIQELTTQKDALILTLEAMKKETVALQQVIEKTNDAVNGVGQLLPGFAAKKEELGNALNEVNADIDRLSEVNLAAQEHNETLKSFSDKGNDTLKILGEIKKMVEEMLQNIGRIDDADDKFNDGSKRYHETGEKFIAAIEAEEKKSRELFATIAEEIIKAIDEIKDENTRRSFSTIRLKLSPFLERQ